MIIAWLRTLLKRSKPAPVSRFDMTIAALLMRDGARQALDAQTLPSPPAKLIGLRKISCWSSRLTSHQFTSIPDRPACFPF